MLRALTLALLAVGCDAARKTAYTRAEDAPGWVRGGRANPDEPLKFTFALKQRNLDKLDALFWAVSDPDSNEYGEFKTPEEINAMVAPAPEEHDAVFMFLRDAGCFNVQSYGDAISAEATVSQIEELFATEMHTFRHETGRSVIRQFGAYSLPEAVAPLVDFVTGISDFPMPRRRIAPAPRALNATQMGSVVPETIQSMYSIPPTTKATSKSSQNVVEYQDDQSFSQADLKTFYSLMDVKTDPVAHIVGPYAPTYPDTEATLDIQYISATGVDAENWYWTEKQWLYDWALSFFNTKDVPLVNSHSWGWSETQQCTISNQCSILGIDSAVYVQRVNVEYKKIGLRGVTMVVASGDSGANGRTDYSCTDPTLHATFPAASPFVTAVGATEVNPATQKAGGKCKACQAGSGNTCVMKGAERAVSYATSNFASGGGFSNLTAMPQYQAEAVSGYLSSGVALPPTGYYNAKGRAYPDVAALGNNYLIQCSGQLQPVGGTSCASPVFGGIVALLNSYRLGPEGTGKPLGFLNPLLYKMAAEDATAFQDITKGNNKCTEMGCAPTCKGYEATKGWDPVTGLGTPNYEKMLGYLKKLDARNAARKAERAIQ